MARGCNSIRQFEFTNRSHGPRNNVISIMKKNTLLVAGVACIGVCQPGFFLSELVFYQAREKM